MKNVVTGSRRRFGVRLALFCSAASGLAAPLLAQDMPRATAVVDDSEIVVTALRRATSVQETPIAISAVSAATLTNQGITTSEGLARVAPNLVVRPNSDGGSRVTIRNIQAPGEPTVGLYYDDTPLIGSGGVSNDSGATTPAVRLFDVERVEVLRGPQGTLYGASAMAGTVRLIFNKPNLSDWGGEVAADVTSIQHGEPGFNTQAALNVPLVDGKLAVRVVGFVEELGGWVDNSTLGKKDVNDNESYGGRALIRWKPTDDLTLDGLAVYQKRTGARATWDLSRWVNGGPKYDQDRLIAMPQSDRLQLYSGTANWDFGFATLTAIGSYSKRDLAFSFDYTPYFHNRASVTAPNSAACSRWAGLADTTNPAWPVTGQCSPAQLASFKQNYVDAWPTNATYQPQSTKTNTQEVRLANGDGRFKWTLGFYHSVRDNFTRSLLYSTNAAGYITPETMQNPGPYLDRYVDDRLSQIAGFGEATYEVLDGLNVTGGVRYFEYKKRTTSAVPVGNFIAGSLANPTPTTDRFNQNGTLLNFNVNYKVTPTVMVYASASQGFRPGGVNQAPTTDPSYQRTYDSDSLWNYEVGVKSTLFDRLLVLNADVFQIDWSNMQISGSFQNAFSFVTNAGKARIRGVEVEATLRPMPGLVLRGSGSYTIGKLTEDQVPPAGAAVTYRGLKGDYIPNVPKITAQGSAEYTFPVSDGMEFTTIADVSYQGSNWSQFPRVQRSIYSASTNANIVPALQRIRAMTMTGLRAGFQSTDGGWGIYAYVTNLFDETGIISKANGPTTGGDNINLVFVQASQPRTFGLNFRKKF
ncbi:TonB-dependent receptor [Sphingomonas quercus]|uniref:TonB-dependent receptor n=1 Tax=Sphingomonas quercus TaxID=2842451 RepID=A0ABS6BJZ4_9SPHN|nr:TonB-dependent receptor [Sphingomonas quercus]MBU3078617.1 TonB-dependent receptor [Sphingomonas quercus]